MEDKVGGSCSTHREMRNAYQISVGTLERKRLLGNLCVDGRIILKWILKK
jgi:hypothetical protein